MVLAQNKRLQSIFGVKNIENDTLHVYIDQKYIFYNFSHAAWAIKRKIWPKIIFGMVLAKNKGVESIFGVKKHKNDTLYAHIDQN